MFRENAPKIHNKTNEIVKSQGEAGAARGEKETKRRKKDAPAYEKQRCARLPGLWECPRTPVRCD